MAAPIGSVSEFDNSKETWSTYIERLESFFNVNDIAQENKSDFLVSVMGSETYGLLKNLMAPTKPSTKPFSELVKTLGDHLDPQPTEMGERFSLWTSSSKLGREHCIVRGGLTTSFPTLWLRRKSVNSKQHDWETNLCWVSTPRPHRKNWWWLKIFSWI